MKSYGRLKQSCLDQRRLDEEWWREACSELHWVWWGGTREGKEAFSKSGNRKSNGRQTGRQAGTRQGM